MFFISSSSDFILSPRQTIFPLGRKYSIIVVLLIDELKVKFTFNLCDFQIMTMILGLKGSNFHQIFISHVLYQYGYYLDDILYFDLK
ncbi:hypothetical protein CEE45_09260 [Candidatus Heimdallarchaeota archaeon B3_Heim]|nr:MAG: hypothetical protein CEE45_09260 [Candidatus Heimdallarchaeota archaeon B3_Heim]